MTLKEANNISIIGLLEKTGFQPITTKERGVDIWYKSPFRPNEHEARFHVDTRRNIWFDFGANKGGSALDFIKLYKDCSEEDALNELAQLFAKKATPKKNAETLAKNNAFALKEVKPLSHPALLSYLTEEKKIKLPTLKKYLVEVAFTHTQEKKDYYAAAMENDANGYEIRNKYFNGFLGKKSLTILRGGEPEGKIVSIFSNLMDFLSAVDYYGNIITANDVIITHHAEFLQKAIQLIKKNNYSTIFTYFENSGVGEEAVKTFQSTFGKRHEPCHGFYFPHNDFSTFWQYFKGR